MGNGKKSTEKTKSHKYVDPDTILTEDDIKSLDAAEADYKAGRTRRL
jgi:hypothetical protein